MFPIFFYKYKYNFIYNKIIILFYEDHELSPSYTLILVHMTQRDYGIRPVEISARTPSQLQRLYSSSSFSPFSIFELTSIS